MHPLVAGMFIAFGLLMAAGMALVPVFVVRARKESAQRARDARSRGWAFQDLQRSHDELRWKGRLPDGRAWRLTTRYADTDAAGGGHSTLVIGNGPLSEGPWSIPEPRDLRWVSLDAGSAAALQILMQDQDRLSPGAGLLARGASALLRMSSQAVMGPQLRRLIHTQYRGQPDDVERRVTLVKSGSRAPAGCTAAIAPLDRFAEQGRIQPPWVFGAPDCVMIQLFATIDLTADIDRLLSASRHLGPGME